ncbi:hypothetical protein QTJ16_000677 [Diplocarpon rosae]|uniref:Uncharacterized protein n=1 Tax=Diplocarpon rosae TaxID=946125 RepID=A0AAD9T6U5_9HELO|nr:hypothetical protein QTJ16_000677 [Diplocarpon rosae]
MLGNLPQEIIILIWGYISQNDVLGLSCVLETVDCLECKNHCTTRTVPLRQVHSWTRGNNLIISATNSHSPIEMAIDSKGIKSIQRSSSSATGSPQSPFVVYSTLGFDENLTIKFQCGVSRLEPKPLLADLQLTDFPNLSPSLGSSFLPQHTLYVLLLSTWINLDCCSGITFFFSIWDLRAIHAHTQATPTAATTFAQINPAFHHAISWVYVPNPPADKISAFGVRILTPHGGKLQLKERTYLVRTPHRGDFPRL